MSSLVLIKKGRNYLRKAGDDGASSKNNDHKEEKTDESK